MLDHAVKLWAQAIAAVGTLFEPELRRAAVAYQARVMEFENEFHPVIPVGERIDRELRARKAP